MKDEVSAFGLVGYMHIYGMHMHTCVIHVYKMIRAMRAHKKIIWI